MNIVMILIIWEGLIIIHVLISWEGQAAARRELVDLLEAIAFLICRW